MKNHNKLLYIVYGDNDVYYQGAKFSILSFLNNSPSLTDAPEIIILTEKPDYFKNYPVSTHQITPEMKAEWSVNGKYHFRIKNRGLKFITDQLIFSESDKLLFIDADTYFNKDPNQLFDLISSQQALMFLNEGLISSKKKFESLRKGIEGVTLQLPSFGEYKLSQDASMWGSLMIGMTPNMFHLLDYADQLMLSLMKKTDIRTIEQFSLVEALKTQFDVVEGKKLIKHYSTSGKKKHAEKVLQNFFTLFDNQEFTQQLNAAKKIKLTRNLYTVLIQKLAKRAS